MQCAIVERQQAIACALSKDDYGLEKTFEKIGKGDTEAKGDIQKGEMSVLDKFKTSSLIGSGSCVDDMIVEIMDQAVVIPLSEYCPAFRAMGAILVVASLLMATMIVTSK